MKKNISIILIIVLLINIIILDIFVFNINNKLNKLNDYVFKDKIQSNNSEEISFIGTYIDKSNEKSDTIMIYDTKKYNFEIIYGDGRGNMIGTYTQNGNILNVKYSDIENNDFVEKTMEVTIDKEGNYIEINNNKYFKVQE
jgi:hypothetical protein